MVLGSVLNLNGSSPSQPTGLEGSDANVLMPDTTGHFQLYCGVSATIGRSFIGSKLRTNSILCKGGHDVLDHQCTGNKSPECYILTLAALVTKHQIGQVINVKTKIFNLTVLPVNPVIMKMAEQGNLDVPQSGLCFIHDMSRKTLTCFLQISIARLIVLKQGS